MIASMNIIDVRGLSRTYKKFTAVDGLSFTVAPGECYGLLGTNGAGKTSALEVLEGLAAPTSGTVEVLGGDPRRDRATLRPRMGIMLQHGGLPSGLTVRETMKLWAGTCSNPQPADALLDQVDLLHKADIKVGALSGGEQRRLDLACALLGGPELIFLDEPTTGLDPESRRNVWRLLRELKESGVTMVLTTHYLEEAEYLCDRLCILHRGRIELEGTLAELVETRASEIVLEPALVPETHASQAIYERDRAIVHTNDLVTDTHGILAWAQDNGVTYTHFAARPATLEDVFLSIAEGVK